MESCEKNELASGEAPKNVDAVSLEKLVVGETCGRMLLWVAGVSRRAA